MQKRHVDGRIGARLTEVRKARGFSQGWLAKRINVSTATIQAYERGRARIAAERLKALADALRCRPDELLTPRPPELIQPKLILPSTLGFYGRAAHSHKVDVDAAIKAACGLAADAPGHLAWQRWYDRIHPENRSRADHELARVLDPQDGIFHMQYRFTGYDGIERTIIDLGRMTFNGNQPVRLQGIMLDITHEPRSRTADDRIAAILATIKKHL